MFRFWHHAFSVQYRILALIDPLVRRMWGRFGMGNVVEVRVARRDGKGDRSRLLGLLRVIPIWAVVVIAAAAGAIVF